MSKKILVLALSIGVAASASAQIISVNMTDGGASGGALSASATAGVELAAYWNEVGPGGHQEPLGGTNPANLLDNSGSASGVSLVQSPWIGGWWASSGWPSGFSGTFGNDLYGSFQDFSAGDGLITYTFDNLNAGVGGLYDVYVYSARNFGNTGVTEFNVNGETKYLSSENNVGDYVESGWSTAADAMNNVDSGNYVRFQNVSLDTLVVGVAALEDTVNGGGAGSVAGLQIVAVPEPATFGLLAIFGGAMLFLRRTRNY